MKGPVLSEILLMPLVWASAAEPAGLQNHASHWVEHYARSYGIPVELVEAVIEVESGWNPYAVSPKGAVGLMQLMPDAAVRFGVWNRFHVQENIRGGVAYLSWLYRFFDGDLRLVTAAYLAGESSIRSRGLAYSSPKVYRYVNRVAELFRTKRLMKWRRAASAGAAKAR